ncbi:MAG: hypothetical protein ABJL54_08525 [Halioglobus sp.]
MKTLSRILVLSAGLLAFAAQGAPTVQIKGGHTSIGISEDLLSQLEGCDITRVKPGNIKPGVERMRFPVSGGALDLGYLEGEIDHRGGINIECATVVDQVRIENFRIDAIPDEEDEIRPMITALVSLNDSIMGRMDFAVPAGDGFEVITHGNTVQLRKASLSLAEATRSFLNTILELGLPENLLVGEANSRINIRSAKGDDDHPGNGLAKGKNKGSGEYEYEYEDEEDEDDDENEEDDS